MRTTKFEQNQKYDRIQKCFLAIGAIGFLSSIALFVMDMIDGAVYLLLGSAMFIQMQINERLNEELQEYKDREKNQ